MLQYRCIVTFFSHGNLCVMIQDSKVMQTSVATDINEQTMSRAGPADRPT